MNPVIRNFSVTSLLSLVTDFGDATINLPIIDCASKSVAPSPTSPILIGRFDPIHSIFTAPLFPAQTHWTVPKEQMQKNILN